MVFLECKDFLLFEVKFEPIDVIIAPSSIFSRISFILQLHKMSVCSGTFSLILALNYKVIVIWAFPPRLVNQIYYCNRRITRKFHRLSLSQELSKWPTIPAVFVISRRNSSLGPLKKVFSGTQQSKSLTPTKKWQLSKRSGVALSCWNHKF